MIYPMIICLGGSPTFGGDLQPLQTHPAESPATSFPCGPITNTWVVSLHLKVYINSHLLAYQMNQNNKN